MYKFMSVSTGKEKEKKALKNDDIQLVFVHVKCWSWCPLEVYFLLGWARRWRCLCLDPDESLEPKQAEQEIS